MSKPKMVTCKYCKTKIDKNTAYIEDYLTDTGVLRNNYYCNERCCESKHKEDTCNTGALLLKKKFYTSRIDL